MTNLDLYPQELPSIAECIKFRIINVLTDFPPRTTLDVIQEAISQESGDAVCYDDSKHLHPCYLPSFGGH